MKCSMKVHGISLACLIVAAPVPAQIEYSVVELEPLAGGDSTGSPGSLATASWGGARVTGYSTIDDLSGALHAYAHDGITVELLPLPGDVHSLAFAANEAGQIVGLSYSLGNVEGRAVLWEDGGTPTDLGAFQPTDIDEDGVVVGEAWEGNSAAWRAVRWQSGVLTDLGDLGGGSASAAATDSGDVVGWSATSGFGPIRGFLWRAGTLHPVGTLGGSWSQARDLRAGQVVGSAQLANGVPHAFLASVGAGGQVTPPVDLGSLGNAASHAFSVNQAGDVVGVADGRAVLWPASGGIVDLNSRIDPDGSWLLGRATEIDDAGRIVGIGVHGGRPRGFLLVPCAASAPYCASGPNSVSLQGATLHANGTASVAGGEVELIATNCPPTRPALFLYSAASSKLPFGDGFLCLAPPQVRLLPIRVSNAAGEASTMVSLSALSLMAGDTAYFQCWYRDPAGGGAFFNLTDGLAVAVCP